MKKLFASTLLTVVAVPFLMAAPAAHKGQNTSTDTMSTKKTKKKKVKSNSKGTTETDTKATSK